MGLGCMGLSTNYGAPVDDQAGGADEDHQLSKHAAVLDSGQVTTWASSHRWTAISLLACIFLAVAAACQRARDGGSATPGLVPSPCLNC